MVLKVLPFFSSSATTSLKASHAAVRLVILPSTFTSSLMWMYGASTNLMLPSVFSISGSGNAFAKVVFPLKGAP